MAARRRKGKPTRFNWQLVVVLVLGLVVLAGTLYGLRKWRRKYMATQALETGMAAYEERNWETAVGDLGRYCAYHPQDFPVWLKYAEAQLRRIPSKPRYVQRAIAAYRKILADDPANAGEEAKQAAERVSAIYIAGGYPSDAEVVLRRRLRDDATNPGGVEDPQTRQILARALAHQGKFKEAAEELDKIIRANPEQVAAYELLSSIRRQRQEEVPGSPLEPLQRAIRANPDSAAACIALADYLEGRRHDTPAAREADRAEAIVNYRTAAAREFGNAATRIRLAGRFLRIAGVKAAGKDRSEVEEFISLAEEQLEAAEEAEPFLLGVWRGFAELARAKGSPEEALSVARRALETLGPDSFSFLPDAFGLFMYAGEEAEAKACLDRIKSMDPESAEISALEARLAQKRSDNYEAISHWKEAARRATDTQKEKNAKMSLANAYAGVNDVSAAVRVLRQLANVYPEDARVRLSLADLLLRNRRWREAAEHAAMAVRLMPGHLTARCVDLSARIENAYVNPNPAQELARMFREAKGLREEFPDDTRVAVVYARVALMLGERESALEAANMLQQDEAMSLQGELIGVQALWDPARPEAAIERLRELTKEHAGNASTVLALADILARSGKGPEAVATIEEAVVEAEGDERRDIRLGLAALRRRLGEGAGEIEVLREVAGEFPLDLRSRMLLLRSLRESAAEAAVAFRRLQDSQLPKAGELRASMERDLAEAQELIDEVRRIEGEDGFRWRYHQAWQWLNSSEWRSHQRDIGELLNANIESDPHNVASTLLLAKAQEMAGNLGMAVENYRRAYLADPYSQPAAFSLVNALQKTGELREAAAVLQEVARHGAPREALRRLQLGQQLMEGDTEAAFTTAEEMLKLNPDDMALRLNIARLKARKGDIEGARLLLEGVDGGNRDFAVANVELLLREGKADDALAVCDELVAADKSALAHLLRATTRIYVGKDDLALEDYEAITRLEEDSARSWVLLSDYYAARSGRNASLKDLDAARAYLAKAIAAVEEALRREPGSPAAGALAARLYWSSQDPYIRRKGETVIDEAIAANPENTALLLMKAQRLVRFETPASLKEAREILGEVTRKNPRMVQAWALLAKASLAEGLTSAALEAISKALEAHPSTDERRDMLLLKAQAESTRWGQLAVVTLEGLWQENRGDVRVGLVLAGEQTRLARELEKAEPAEKAIVILQEMESRIQDPDAEMTGLTRGNAAILVKIALAEAFEASGNGAKALEVAAAAMRANPEDLRALLVVVRLSASTGRWEVTESALADWQNAHPDDVVIPILAAEKLLSLARTLEEGAAAERKRGDQSAEMAQRILRESAERHPDDMQTAVALGVAFQTRGASSEAEKQYRRVLEKTPEGRPQHRMALNNLAWLMAETAAGLPEALELADRGRRLYPDFVELIDTRGIICQRMGKLDEARRDFQEAIRLAPKNSSSAAPPRFHLARILAEAGEKTEAIRLLTECLGGAVHREGLSREERRDAEGLLRELSE